VLATNTWCAAQRTSGPVVSVVGKGHLPGIVYAVQQLVEWMGKTDGHPIRIAPAVAEAGEAAVSE
jgi:pheromone shutdown protein TraB